MTPAFARAAWLVSVLPIVAGCAGGGPMPAALDTRTENCRWCRMAVSDARLAAQLVAPGEEPSFFDDIGCLASFIKQRAPLPGGTAAFVADHRTKAWIPAARALYTRVPRLETPMGSHLVAHADASSRDADPDARGGSPVTTDEVFGPGVLPHRREAERP